MSHGAIADFINQNGSNGHDIYVFNYDPLVYAYAHAAPPTRFVLGIELSEFSESSGSRPAGEITRILGYSSAALDCRCRTVSLQLHAEDLA